MARVALLLSRCRGSLPRGLGAARPPVLLRGVPRRHELGRGHGPYNEHLVRDIGGLVNGLSVVAIVAAWSLSRPLLAANALGWSVYALPHLGYHLSHPLDDAGMQTLNVLVLGSEVVLPVLGLLGASWGASVRATASSDRAHPSTAHAR